MNPSPFAKSRAIENRYARTLRGIAAHVGGIVNGFASPIEDTAAEESILQALARYAALLGPWSQAVAARIVAEVDRQDASAWVRHARMIRRDLRAEIFTAPTGQVMRESIGRQVGLITSLPTEAGIRVHHLALEARIDGTRAAELAKDIAATGSVTKSRATLIARTEIARTGAELTQARSLAVGADQYIWRTVGDSDVREDHQILDGHTYYFRDPPVADRRSGARANPGCIFNCRCWAQPLVPD